MTSRILKASILILLAVATSLTVNSLSPAGIPLIGNWPSVSDSDSVAVPPSAEAGDPPFISLDEAAALYQRREVIFIDARNPEDYIYGHIRGAINIPYDFLPVDRLEEFWRETVQVAPKENDIVTYCSGLECESSLHLGREMASQGYTKIHIFYGGWREWERAGLPITQGNQPK